MIDDSEIPDCPSCGGNMILRENSHTGKKFYGCRSFPKCKGVEQVENQEALEPLLPSDRFRTSRRYD